MNWLWYCMLGAPVQLEPELLRSRYSASVDHLPLESQSVRCLVGVCFLAIITAVQSYKEGDGHHIMSHIAVIAGGYPRPSVQRTVPHGAPGVGGDGVLVGLVVGVAVISSYHVDLVVHLIRDGTEPEVGVGH